MWRNAKVNKVKSRVARKEIVQYYTLSVEGKMSREILLEPTLTEKTVHQVFKKLEVLIEPSLGGRQEPKEIISALHSKGTIGFLRAEASLAIAEKPGKVTPKRRGFLRRGRRRVSCYSPDHGKPAHQCRRGILLIKD